MSNQLMYVKSIWKTTQGDNEPSEAYFWPAKILASLEVTEEEATEEEEKEEEEKEKEEEETLTVNIFLDIDVFEYNYEKNKFKVNKSHTVITSIRPLLFDSLFCRFEKKKN